MGLRRVVALLLTGTLVALFTVVGAAASTPPAGTVTVPSSAGGTAMDNWTGTIPPGINPTSDCTPPSPSTPDSHFIQINVPAGTYQTVNASFAFSISWNPGTPTEDTADEILTVLAPDGSEVGSSDTASTTETVNATNLPAGKYTVLACGFNNELPQDYSGKLVVKTTSASSESSLPSADARGLKFSAAVPADVQRDEAEPLMETGKDGRIYTCGPTGFSNISDYAQVSTDGGDQFHMLGTPPRGQQGAGGGGDCGIALGVNKNIENNYQYAYTGLGPLTGFVTSTSEDNGHRLATGGPFGNGVTDKGGGADRQWMTFTSAKDVLLIYNQQEPRNVVVQKSSDGGLTYSPLSAVAAHDPDFPGPIRYDQQHHLAYFGWSRGDHVNLSVSRDGGTSWFNCRAATAPASPAGFVTVDNDSAGNIYMAYGEKAKYHTYMTELTADRVSKCDQKVDQDPTSTEQPTVNPGFSPPVQVDRNGVRTTVFPWIAAGATPGRVAVAFYGTESDGNPNLGSFKASWDVYVNQSLNALSSARTFSQVKATTHPFHYDSICLNGLGCDLSVPPGDRSLADFFAIDYNQADKKLSVVFDRGNKKPDEASGHVATPMVTTQIAGPTNGGTSLTAPASRAVVRTFSADPTKDALARYSFILPEPPERFPPTENEPGGDFTSVAVGPQVNLNTGQPVANGGFTVTMKLSSLSDASLTQAMTGTDSQSLLWVFHFVNGYQASAASARYNPAQGFTFGYNNYTTGSAPCQSSLAGNGDKCVLFPGDTPIQGKVDRATGTIRLSVPRILLKGLSGGTGPDQRPSQVPATNGTRFYDATAFSMGNPVSPTQDVQSFLYPLDNTPAMDFLLGSGG